MKEKYQLSVRKKSFLSDTITPVGAYLKLRDRYANSLLLESSDYHGEENSFSYICFAPISTFQATHEGIEVRYPGEGIKKLGGGVFDAFIAFRSNFD